MTANCDSTWFGVGHEWIRKLLVDEKFWRDGLPRQLVCLTLAQRDE
jgi:hypothetical protein